MPPGDKIELVKSSMPSKYPVNKPLGLLNAVLTAGGEQDQANTDTIKLVKDMVFLETAEGDHLDVLGNNYGIARPPGLNDTIYRNLIRHVAFQPRTILNIIHQVLEDVFGPRTVAPKNWDVHNVNPAEIIVSLYGVTLPRSTDQATFFHPTLKDFDVRYSGADPTATVTAADPTDPANAITLSRSGGADVDLTFAGHATIAALAAAINAEVDWAATNIRVDAAARATELGPTTLAVTEFAGAPALTIAGDLTVLAWPQTGQLVIDRGGANEEAIPFAKHDGSTIITLTGVTGIDHVLGESMVVPTMDHILTHDARGPVGVEVYEQVHGGPVDGAGRYPGDYFRANSSVAGLDLADVTDPGDPELNVIVLAADDLSTTEAVVLLVKAAGVHVRVEAVSG